MNPSFVQLNIGWNAEPNAPSPQACLEGEDVILRFQMNSFRFPDFHTEERGFLRFVNCSQFRLGPTNDEGWYLGQCRFSRLAPNWGDFYAISGDPRSVDGPADWIAVEGHRATNRTHFLFYFRDETFECVAERCVIEPDPRNALIRTAKLLAEI